MNLVSKYGKVIGYFEGMQPNLVITDAELIKQIFVKDFDHFINRRVSENSNTFNQFSTGKRMGERFSFISLMQDFNIETKIIRKRD